jgi:hypothetical protein
MRRSVVGINGWKQYMQFAVISTLGRMPSTLGRIPNLPRPPHPAHPPHPLPHTILVRKPPQRDFHGDIAYMLVLCSQADRCEREYQGRTVRIIAPVL